MSFSNPASQAKGAASEYIKALLTLLGDRNPFEVQENLLSALEAAVKGLDDAALRKPEKPGKWSILQVIQHLADTELVSGYRIRMILAHDQPPIPAYDQDFWANALKYNEVKVEDAIEQIRTLRKANLRLLRSLTPAQMQRYGLHEERGRESIERILKMTAGHDLVHLRQIERIKQAIK
jgi:hypothetical protein